MALVNLMSTIKGAAATSLGAYAEIKGKFKEAEAILFSKQTAGQLNQVTAGLESDSIMLSALNTTQETIQSQLGQIFGSADFGVAGLESAARTVMLLGDTELLHNSLKEADLELAAGLESFSPTALGNFREATVEANAMAAQGTGLMEALYPSIEVGAAYGGVKISVQRFCKIGNTVNNGAGAQISWDRQHLVEAYRKTGMLDSNTNMLYPIVVTGTNEEYFPDAKLIPTMLVPENTEGLRTAPIKATTKKINLLGLSRVPTTNQGTGKHTFNDRINEGARLQSIYISAGEAAATKHAFEFPLDLYNTAQFIKGAHIEKRNTTHAVLDVTSLTLDLTTTIAKAVPELKAIADLGYIKVTFAIEINAKLDLHDGNFSQTFSEAEVHGIYKENDEVNYITDDAVAALITAVAPKYEAVKIKASLSSKTLRLRGDRVDEEVIPYTFLMSALPPITADRAVTESQVNDILGVMGAAEMMRRESQCVQHIVSKIDDLYELFGKGGAKIDPHGSNMVGMAYISRPWIKKESIKVDELVNVLESRDRIANISNSLIALLGDRGMRAITETNYLESKRTYTKNPTAKAEFNLLSSRVIGRYLYTDGEERTFGAADGDIKVTPNVITTSLDIMDDKIIMVLKGDSDNSSLDVWGWGNTLRGTTLVYDVELTEGDSTKRHLQLQPFYEFVVNMPIAYELEVIGLEAYLASKASLLVKHVA